MIAKKEFKTDDLYSDLDDVKLYYPFKKEGKYLINIIIL